MLTKWLTRDKSDLIVGIDYDNAEVYLYNGGVVSANTTADEWYAQGILLGAMV